MSHPCRESELDALLAGELTREEARRVEAHAATCDECTRALAWLRLERQWMARRARGMPSRPALRFSALEARLHPPAPHRGEWAHRGRMALGAVAAVLCVGFSLLSVQPSTRWPEQEWAGGEGLVSRAPVAACMDLGGEEVARHEARLGACLLASPVMASSR
ncbi:MAG TPA: zf-HC2 domain-containing protein [Myxococcaceae bacterium]|nr:zf-HC2 domain-containing protein [Myxococcaceae bacterium]